MTARQTLLLSPPTLKAESWTHGSSLSGQDDIHIPHGNRCGGTNLVMDDDGDRPPNSHLSLFRRAIDSFRRDPSAAPSRVYTSLDPPASGSDAGPNRVFYYDLRHANRQTSSPALARKLKGRHLQMIAIGGSVGTGLFVASGRALETGGPASLLLAFVVVGAMLYCTSQALGELAVMFPVAGSFSAWATRFLDPSWGFAMGWNYGLQWLIVLPLETIAASLTLQYWDDRLERAIFVTLFLLIILAINLMGVEGYGEAQFLFSILKVTAIIGFILFGIVVNIGGPPNGGYIGGRYWNTPGAFNHGFKGVCSVLVTAAFSFAGTELVGLAAAETAQPRKSIPTAIKQVFWRILLFYIVSLTLVGLLVPFDESRLLNGSSSADAKASPFVIAIEQAGIAVLPSVMNAIILFAVLSVGNAAVFGSSRTFAALADQRQAPHILSYIDRKGRPLIAIAVAIVVGFVAFVVDLPWQGSVLDWLLAASGLSSVFTWGSICLCHIRFRAAWTARHRPLSDIPFRAQLGVAGSWIGLVLNILVLIAQFWVAAYPIGYKMIGPSRQVQNFFLKYMSVPIVIAFYALHKLIYQPPFVTLDDMDIDTGRRDFNLPLLVALEAGERRAWPRWKQIYKLFC